MPLEWNRKKNPYRHNLFTRVGVGPNTPPIKVDHIGKNTLKKIRASDNRAIEQDGVVLDEFALEEAVKELMNSKGMARLHDLLLVHPSSQTDRHKAKDVTEKLGKALVWPEEGQERCPPPLVHPLALLWFIPPPGAEIASLPPWEAFGFVEAGDEQDLALDIVLDS